MSICETAANNALTVWGYEIPADMVDDDTSRYLGALPEKRPSVMWVWSEMDRVWTEIAQKPGCVANRKSLLDNYYAHPVWLLNGIFTATDPESIEHRKLIAGYAASLCPRRVIDYGGGFGELARVLASRVKDAQIDIVEPYPSAIGRAAVESIPNVRFSAELYGTCDLLIAQDVLEHVETPVELAIRMASTTKTGGYLIFANCFWPVIKCHLPETFYLRHTFRFVMKGLGLEFMGTVPGAPHAEIYRKPAKLRINSCRARNRAAKVIGGLLSLAEDSLRRAWRRARNP